MGPENARSGTSGIIATVFGASGFLGRYITSSLGQAGAIVFVTHRGEEYEVRHLKVCGDLGMVQPFQIELRDKQSVLESMARSDVVFNCIGKEHNTFNYTVEESNAESARIIAECAAEAGVQRLVHVSCLSAHEHAPTIIGRSKFLGEQYVKEAFPDATILRPAPMFGWEDKLVTAYAREIAVKEGAVEHYGYAHSRFQPVSVIDVADAAVTCATEDTAIGNLYELGGPKTYSFDDFIGTIASAMGKEKRLIGWPAFVGDIKGMVMEKAPNPIFTRDTPKMWLQDRVVSANALGFHNLGIDPTSMDEWLWEITRDHRKVGKLQSLKPGDDGYSIEEREVDFVVREGREREHTGDPHRFSDRQYH
jgi:NADH dehydrogenase (ubiquinone) 1 alpha subcomplex subunit 9